jgi:hypothetical protein
MLLARDIVKKIEQAFPPQDAPKAVELLAAAGESARVSRCIVFLADGNLERLTHYIKAAAQDCRNVIFWAEYDDGELVRQFSDSFLIDTPLNIWISRVASTLARREYYLSTIETVPTNCAVARCHGDLGEGIATFDGDLGEILVVKSRGQWLLKGNQAELEIYGLHKPFADESEFTDRVSGHILTKRRPLK